MQNFWTLFSEHIDNDFFYTMTQTSVLNPENV